MYQKWKMIAHWSKPNKFNDLLRYCVLPSLTDIVQE